jgi:hypothetical protein
MTEKRGNLGTLIPAIRGAARRVIGSAQLWWSSRSGRLTLTLPEGRGATPYREVIATGIATPQSGDLLVESGAGWDRLARGSAGQVLGAGESDLSWMDALVFPSSAMPSWEWCAWIAAPNARHNAIGESAATVAASTTATNWTSTGLFSRRSTSATAANVAYWRYLGSGSDGVTRYDQKPSLLYYGRCGVKNQAHIFIGFTAGGLTFATTNTNFFGANVHIGIGYRSASDSTWIATCHNGTTHQTQALTGATVVDDETIIVEVEINASSATVRLKKGDGTSYSHTFSSNLPASTTLLSWWAAVGRVAIGGSNSALDMQHLTIRRRRP